MHKELDVEHKDATLAVRDLPPSLEAAKRSVDAAWAALSRTRLEELESGEVKGVSWQDIKNEVQG